MIRHLKCAHNIVKQESAEKSEHPNPRKRERSSDLDSDEEDSLDAEEMIDRHVQNKSIKLEICPTTSGDNKPEFINVSTQPVVSPKFRANGKPAPETAEEEKFIRAVYPEFKGKTKLELIDEIRLLRDKVNVFKGTIDRLLK